MNTQREAPQPLAHATIARRRLFSSAHFYRQEKFSESENRQVFGRCYTPHGHGHNYVLEVFVTGPILSETKLVVNLAEIDEILIRVTDPLDHQHLNFDLPHFSTNVPTTENIALYLRDQLIQELRAFPKLKLQRLRLFETDDLWVEILE